MIDTQLGAGTGEPIVAMGCYVRIEWCAEDGFKYSSTDLIGSYSRIS